MTSQAVSAGRSTEEVAEKALEGGVRLIQLREKDLGIRDLTALAERVRAMTAAADALLIINDRVDVALAVGADGVHLGQEDLPIPAARRIAPDFIIGASSHSVAEAVRAEQEGASYVNIGPLFATRTKEWTQPFLGIGTMKTIAASLTVPFTVMGGIKAEHIPALREAGAHTIAVVTAVTAATHPDRAVRDLLDRMGTG